MSAAVAIADEVCRTVLWLAAIGAFVKVAPLFLPRLQVSAPKNPPALPKPPQQDEVPLTIAGTPSSGEAA